MTVESKKTGKKFTKRVYQRNALEEYAVNGNWECFSELVATLEEKQMRKESIRY